MGHPGPRRARIGTFAPAVLADLEARIGAIAPRGPTLLIGIDGRGGSGKSTLARDLAEVLGGVTIVRFDDFYLPSLERAARRDDEIGGDFDWRRLREQVLEPLAAGRPGRYQRYDWDRDELAEWHDVPVRGVLMVEGNYVTRPELRSYYELRIWVDTPRDVRLGRGIARDGEEARSRWVAEWMPEEDRYVAACDPASSADVVVDGSPDQAGRPM